MEWIVQLPILLFSVVVHELAHGWTAKSRGDDTAERAGRLTLNPLAHLDPFGTLFLPAFCMVTRLPLFAWAKPVPVDPARLARPRSGMLQVALAGPCANLALALAGALLFRLSAALPLPREGLRATLLEALIFATSINLFLAFFNLLPVHPLDGQKVLAGLLPAAWRARYERLAPYGLLILLLLAGLRLLQPLVVLPSQYALGLLARAGLIW